MAQGSLTDLLGQLIGGATAGPNSNPVDINAALGGGAPAMGNPAASVTPGNIGRPFSRTEMIRGPFGTKGALGDILGTIGDMVLKEAGLAPQYTQRKQVAKVADALDGFDEDPIAAVHRLVNVDPDRAQQLFNDLQTNNYKMQLQTNAVNQDARQQALLPGQLDEQRLKSFGAFASMANAADKNSWGTVRRRISDAFAARGMGSYLEGLPESYDKAAIEKWANGSVSVDKQTDNERQADTLAETEDYHKQTLGLKSQEVGLHAQSVANQRRNTDDVIGFRAWQKKHGDKTANTAETNAKSQAEYRKWLQDHPSKNRLDPNSPPPLDPADHEGVTASAAGVSWTSDGKKWNKVSK